MSTNPELLAIAERCGAIITGKPDGSEPINVVFTPDTWQAFDAAARSALSAHAEAHANEIATLHRCIDKLLVKSYIVEACIRIVRRAGYTVADNHE